MSLANELKELEDLRARGVLTEEEFHRAKQLALSKPADGGNVLRAFHRSLRDRWLGGICGGLGEITPIPAWGWRLAFVLLAIYFGTGILLYVLLWIFVPAGAPDEPRA